MRIIFSRKGFDSSYGGSPSPILEDGTIVSFPIPAGQCDKGYKISYADLRPQGLNMGKLIDDLTVTTSKGKVSSKDMTHFDPDICENTYMPRELGWRGLFGQCGAAQGHLRNKSVGKGDLFLFYGLYQRVKKLNGTYSYDKSSRPIHLIWGWMQVGEMVDIAKEQASNQTRYLWAAYHPHYHFKEPPCNNTLYVASEILNIDGIGANQIKGFGVFEHYRENLQLTDPDYDKTSYWRLPSWLYKEGQPCPVSYNHNREWKLDGGFARLQSYTRAQEYVVHIAMSQRAVNWIDEFFEMSNDDQRHCLSR